VRRALLEIAFAFAVPFAAAVLVAWLLGVM